MALCLVVLLAMQTGLSAAAAPAAPGSGTETVAPPLPDWHALELQDAGMIAALTTRIDLKELPAAALRSVLIDGPERLSRRLASPRVRELAVTSTVQLLLGAGIETRSRLWFNADDGLPLQLVRTSRGSNPARKLYRFGSHEVYRLRSKPADSTESSGPAEAWSRRSESYYPLPAPDEACPAILESSQLLYLLTRPAPAASETPEALCLFDRKHVYRVELRTLGREQLDVDYLQVIAGREIRVRDTLQSVHVMLDSKPLEESREDTEPFSFLGLQGEIHLLLSDPGRIPLRIRGQVPGYGEIELELGKLAR